MTELLQRLLDAPPERLSQVALEWAAQRGVLPSALSSRDQLAAFSDAVRARSVFSARTTSAVYLQEVKDAIDVILTGGFESDLPEMRRRLKDLLTWLGYSPETGFPGDDELDIPPARPGSLRDLSSDRRINLMLETQISLARGASQKQRGLEAERREQFPAWELIRFYRRRVPRGSADSNSQGWGGRWLRAGGPVVEGGRLVALKDDPVWRALGDKDLFDDAIGVDTPPFAFNSGMRWVEVSRAEAEALGLLEATTARPVTAPEAGDVLPDPEVSLRGLDPELRRKLIEETQSREAETPGHIRFNRILEREAERSRESYDRRSNWMENFLAERRAAA